MSLKNKVLTFAGAVIACGIGFVLMDIALMNMQGLSLFFQR